MVEPEFICKKMKEIRKQKKLTQKEVAKNMGISRTMYAQLECGAKKPNMEHISTFSEYCGMLLSEFIRECEELMQMEIFAEYNDIMQMDGSVND